MSAFGSLLSPWVVLLPLFLPFASALPTLDHLARRSHDVVAAAVAHPRLRNSFTLFSPFDTSASGGGGGGASGGQAPSRSAALIMSGELTLLVVLLVLSKFAYHRRERDKDRRARSRSVSSAMTTAMMASGLAASGAASSAAAAAAAAAAHAVSEKAGSMGSPSEFEVVAIGTATASDLEKRTSLAGGPLASTPRRRTSISQ